MEQLYNHSNSLYSEILQVKKDINFFSSIDDKDKSVKFHQKISELTEFLNELIILKRDVDEAIELNQKYEEKLSLNKILNDKYHQEYVQDVDQMERILKEANDVKENLENISNYSQFENEFRNQMVKHQTHESQLNIIRNDYKLINQIKQAETTLANCIEKYSKDSSSSEEFFLYKYYIVELLNSVKIIERPDLKHNSNYENNLSNWFEIAFTNLPDDVLDFENNSENHPLLSKTKKSQLSKELLDKYRSIFKKRKKGNNKSSRGCVVVNELDDFQIIFKSYLQLLCYIMTKQEIEEAKKQFALDWIEGSQVLTILINSKSSKMATVVLPKNYPLCDQSLIKLISLSGYEDLAIKNFRIRKNVANLSEWISELTNLYNSNQIVIH